MPFLYYYFILFFSLRVDHEYEMIFIAEHDFNFHFWLAYLCSSVGIVALFVTGTQTDTRTHSHIRIRMASHAIASRIRRVVHFATSLGAAATFCVTDKFNYCRLHVCCV